MSNHAPLQILLVEDTAMLGTILNGRSISEAFPTVKKIILMEPGCVGNADEGILTWQELLHAGDGVPDSALDKIEAEQCVNHACMVLYTSGTTGLPKGAVLGQVSRNLVAWI
jgi:long-subunit acyl-CoA synthetase (AMP-forming)